MQAEHFQPYILSNGLTANTELEATIDADWNGLRSTRARKQAMKSIATDKRDIMVLYDAMGIDTTPGISRDQCTFINEVGYSYKS